jgi:hypothetical protein
MTSPLQRFAREIKQARKRKKAHETVDVTAEAVTFARRKASDTLSWDDVSRISAGTHAMVSGEVFFVIVEGAGTSLEIDEFVEGYSGFERALVEHFPAIREKITALQTSSSRDERLEVVWPRASAQ